MVAINRPIMAGVIQSFEIIARAQQRVDIKSGDALQPQHDRVGASEALEPPLIRSGGGPPKRIDQGNVHLVGFCLTLCSLPPGNTPAELLHRRQQLIDLRLLQQALHGTQADAIVGGDEIEIDRAVLRGGHRHHPGR